MAPETLRPTLTFPLLPTLCPTVLPPCKVYCFSLLRNPSSLRSHPNSIDSLQGLLQLFPASLVASKVPFFISQRCPLLFPQHTSTSCLCRSSSLFFPTSSSLALEALTQSCFQKLLPYLPLKCDCCQPEAHFSRP